MRYAADLLAQWKVTAAAPDLHKALDAAQGGRYSVLLNRELMSALARLDPEQARANLLGRGFPESEIEAAFALNQLHRIPEVLKPRQKKIALTRPSIPDPEQ